MSSTTSSRLPQLILIAGDLLMLLVFVAAGQRVHNLVDEQDPVMGLLSTTGAYALAWLVSAGLVSAFPRGGLWPPRSLLSRTLNAWLVAAPLAVLLRAFILGRAVIPTAFLAVTLVLGGACLLGWRLVFALVWSRLTR